MVVMRTIREQGEGRVGFRVRVQPSAPTNELLGWNTVGELRIKVAAPPREGAANRELVSFLARYFSVGRKEIRIERGKKSRAKTISAPSSIRQPLLEIPEI